MPFISEEEYQLNTSGFSPDSESNFGSFSSSGSTEAAVSYDPGLLKRFSMSSFNPSRDLAARATGELLERTPTFKTSEAARRQAEDLGDVGGPSSQQILSESGAMPTNQQVAGSALETAATIATGGLSSATKSVTTKAIMPIVNKLSSPTAKYLAIKIPGLFARMGIEGVGGAAFSTGKALQEETTDPDELKRQAKWGAIFGASVPAASGLV